MATFVVLRQPVTILVSVLMTPDTLARVEAITSSSICTILSAKTINFISKKTFSHLLRKSTSFWGKPALGNRPTIAKTMFGIIFL